MIVLFIIYLLIYLYFFSRHTGQDSVCFLMMTPLYRLSLHNRIFLLISLITTDPYTECMVMQNYPSHYINKVKAFISKFYYLILFVGIHLQVHFISASGLTKLKLCLPNCNDNYYLIFLSLLYTQNWKKKKLIL